MWQQKKSGYNDIRKEMHSNQIQNKVQWNKKIRINILVEWVKLDYLSKYKYTNEIDEQEVCGRAAKGSFGYHKNHSVICALQKKMKIIGMH